MANIPPQMEKLLLAGAEGAYPIGTNIEKVNCETGDLHPLGTKGVVLGSIGVPKSTALEFQRTNAPDKPLVKFMYCVLFEDTNQSILIMDSKIKSV